ncbi:17832_t:CDS:1, partial [Cetraspora pellucida]
MSTSAGEKVPLPTVNEVEGLEKTEDLVSFLRTQRLRLEDKHFNVFYEQEVDGEAFLRLNVDKLIAHPYKLPGGPAEKISGLIEKIKGEGQ